MPERDLISFLLQKTGHFLEYFLLAWLAYRAVKGTLARWGLAAEPAMRSRLAYSLALAMAVLFAISDEWHQSFVPTREPTLRDVLIDTAGALTALAVARRLDSSHGASLNSRRSPALQRDPQ